MHGKSTNEPGSKDASPWPLRRNRYSVRFRKPLASTKPAINEAVGHVMRIARRCGCLDEREADLEIALREALANAVIHGNSLQHFKRIYLRCYGAPQRGLVIAIRDEGDGFEPDQVPDPRTQDRLELDHGRGLFLMRALMDYVEHRKNGREVVLFLRCGAAEGDPGSGS